MPSKPPHQFVLSSQETLQFFHLLYWPSGGASTSAAAAAVAVAREGEKGRTLELNKYADSV